MLNIATCTTGCLLLIAPFLLVIFFSDKKRGILFILFFVLFFHLVVAFFTQFLSIFYYQVIFWITLITDAAVLAFLVKFRRKFSLKLRDIDWLALVIIIVAVATLWQVHHNYTGKIGLATDSGSNFKEVKNMEYIYPYFSDEWYSVAFIKGSIGTHGLPFKNILDNGFFLNLEVFTHSFWLR